MAWKIKSSFDVHSIYDHVFSWATTIVTCVLVNETHCIIFGQVESIMTMCAKVQKPSLIIKILICR
jgi:hypothetical protein